MNALPPSRAGRRVPANAASVLSAFLLPTLLALAAVAPLPARAAAAAKGPATKAAAPGAHAHAVVPFIEDDYTRALAEARQRNLPLFIESWAPW